MNGIEVFQTHTIDHDGTATRAKLAADQAEEKATKAGLHPTAVANAILKAYAESVNDGITVVICPECHTSFETYRYWPAKPCSDCSTRRLRDNLEKIGARITDCEHGYHFHDSCSICD